MKRITPRTMRCAQLIQKRLEAPVHPTWTYDDWQNWQKAQVLLSAVPMRLRPVQLYRA